MSLFPQGGPPIPPGDLGGGVPRMAAACPCSKQARKVDGIPPPLVQLQPPEIGRALMGHLFCERRRARAAAPRRRGPGNVVQDREQGDSPLPTKRTGAKL